MRRHIFFSKWVLALVVIGAAAACGAEKATPGAGSSGGGAGAGAKTGPGATAGGGATGTNGGAGSGATGSGSGSGSASNGTSGSGGVSSTSFGPGAVATIPFNGAGTSGQNGLITSGISPSSCENTSAFNGTTVTPVGPDYVTCFYSASVSPTLPLAFIQQDEEMIGGKDLIHVRLTLNPSFVDNTYGNTAIGWGGTDAGAAGMGGMVHSMGMGHSFWDLVDSDHAEFDFKNSSGSVVLSFNLDYVSADTNSPSGYACLGVSGGDGNMLVGSASDVVYYGSSLARNLTACGYGSYTVNSPATDANYDPNPATPNWDYDVVYDVWVRKDALPSGWSVSIPYVHASPSKMASTYTVVSAPCPPLRCVGEGCTTGGGCVGEGCSQGGCVGADCDGGSPSNGGAGGSGGGSGSGSTCVGENCGTGTCVGAACSTGGGAGGTGGGAGGSGSGSTCVGENCGTGTCVGAGCSTGGGAGGTGGGAGGAATGGGGGASDAGFGACVGEGCATAGQCYGLLCDGGAATQCYGEGCAAGGGCTGSACGGAGGGGGGAWCSAAGSACTDDTACCSGFCSEGVCAGEASH